MRHTTPTVLVSRHVALVRVCQRASLNVMRWERTAAHGHSFFHSNELFRSVFFVSFLCLCLCIALGVSLSVYLYIALCHPAVQRFAAILIVNSHLHRLTSEPNTCIFWKLFWKIESTKAVVDGPHPVCCDIWRFFFSHCEAVMNFFFGKQYGLFGSFSWLFTRERRVFD